MSKKIKLHFKGRVFSSPAEARKYFDSVFIAASEDTGQKIVVKFPYAYKKSIRTGKIIYNYKRVPAKWDSQT